MVSKTSKVQNAKSFMLGASTARELDFTNKHDDDCWGEQNDPRNRQQDRCLAVCDPDIFSFCCISTRESMRVDTTSLPATPRRAAESQNGSSDSLATRPRLCKGCEMRMTIATQPCLPISGVAQSAQHAQQKASSRDLRLA